MTRVQVISNSIDHRRHVDVHMIERDDTRPKPPITRTIYSTGFQAINQNLDFTCYYSFTQQSIKTPRLLHAIVVFRQTLFYEWTPATNTSTFYLVLFVAQQQQYFDFDNTIILHGSITPDLGTR